MPLCRCRWSSTPSLSCVVFLTCTAVFDTSAQTSSSTQPSQSTADAKFSKTRHRLPCGTKLAELGPQGESILVYSASTKYRHMQKFGPPTKGEMRPIAQSLRCLHFTGVPSTVLAAWPYNLNGSRNGLCCTYMHTRPVSNDIRYMTLKKHTRVYNNVPVQMGMYCFTSQTGV